MAEAAPEVQDPKTAALDFSALAACGLSLRRSAETDQPFEQALFAGFRADEMALVPWPPAQKQAFLNQQFRLQHHHFVTHFSGADFWIVERLLPSGANAPVGRFYLDRSAPIWHVIDIGFVPEARGQGIGTALLKWAQASALAAGASGIDLQVLVTNGAAEKLYRSLGFRPEGDDEGFHRQMRWQASA
jgi:RimJ/RimL family protein N-acetyltransferase